MSLSAQQQKEGNRKVKQWLENDKRIVTYRDISREISCHVNHAKNLLSSYHSSHQATATYILTGPLLRSSTLTYTQLPPTTQAAPKATQSLAHLGGQVKIVDMDQMSDGEANSEVDEDEDEVRMTNDDGATDGGGLGIKGADDDHDGELEAEETPRWGVVLVSEEGLEEKKTLFEQDRLSIHVYSLSPTPVKDPGQFLLSQLSLRTNEKYLNPAIYGTITGEGFKASTEPMRDGGIKFGASAPAPAKKKEEPVKKGKKEEVKAPVKEERQAKAKVDKGTEKQAVEPAKPEPEAPNADTIPKANTKNRRSVSPAKISAKPKKAESAKAGPSSSQIRADDQAAMEAMMDMDEDFDLDAEDLGEAAAPVQAVKTEPVERKRKRRTVKKSKMEMDDKGYMVTKDYDTEESYSGESEPETAKSSSKAKPAPAPAKKAPPPAPSRTASTTSVESDRKPNISKTASGQMKKGAGGQSTLQGFFKKK